MSWRNSQSSAGWGWRMRESSFSTNKETAFVDNRLLAHTVSRSADSTDW